MSIFSFFVSFPFSLFLFLFIFGFCFCFPVEGFKGQVRWPKGPPRLAPLNPPYLFFFVLSFLCFNRNKPVFPLNRAFLFIFECLPLFLLSLFWPPLFHFLFLCLFFFYFILSSCLSYLLSFGSLCLSLSLFLVFLCFCFMRRTTPKY